MTSREPFELTGYQDDSDNPATRVTCKTGKVPNGKQFVVEHISGYFVVKQNDVVDSILATTSKQTVYLPVHFASRPLNFGGKLGVAKKHQFGSPVRMYINGGRELTVMADANQAGVVVVYAAGYIINQ